jgi:hypothetical protein
LSLALAPLQAGAADRDPSPPCTVFSKRLPSTIELPADLTRIVEVMLLRSATFREQCRRIAEARWLVVRVRVDPRLAEGSYRGRSVIDRFGGGALKAVVEISHRNAPEWIAHEFEHLIEQLDGVNLVARSAEGSDVWRSGEGMFESARAMLAGRAVLHETQRRRPQPDKFVD